MATVRYNQTEAFFQKLFQTPAMMEQVMDGICRSLYNQLRNNPQMGLEMGNGG